MKLCHYGSVLFYLLTVSHYIVSTPTKLHNVNDNRMQQHALTTRLSELLLVLCFSFSLHRFDTVGHVTGAAFDVLESALVISTGSLSTHVVVKSSDNGLTQIHVEHIR